MDTIIKIWFPDYYTEAHRSSPRGMDLALALKSEGIEPFTSFNNNCEAVFCGSIYRYRHVEETLNRFESKIPVFQYSWDIYPFQLEADPGLWLSYIEALKKCEEIWVPSGSCRHRCLQYVGRMPYVIFPGIKPYENPPEPIAGDYVLDVVRKYPDLNANLCQEVCKELGIQCISTNCGYAWDEFVKLVASARVLVSAQYEASTGGLTLLEGHYLGKHVLVSDSPFHGAREYIDQFRTFQWHSRENFKNELKLCYKTAREGSLFNTKVEIEREFSDRAMARRIANRLKEVLRQ